MKSKSVFWLQIVIWCFFCSLQQFFALLKERSEYLVEIGAGEVCLV
jgi:hypothetical protein